MSESDKSGKPELTAEDEKVIDTIINNHYAIHIAPTQLDIRLRHIAKTIMLHERSAAQARIAELEARVEELEEALVIAWRDQMNVTKF